MTGWTIAADVGGTFTDVVLTSAEGSYYTAKLLSSPPDFERAVLDGIRAILDTAGLRAADLGSVLHGTTVATNSVMSRTARPAALVTTQGFIDVLEIGRLRIPNSYDLNWRKPEPLAPRRYRLTAAERILADGSVQLPLDAEQVVSQMRGIAGDVDAVAVSFLNSYLNDAHEHMARDAIARAFPHLAVTCGADLVREAGEVERTSTAVLNAYLIPVMARYLSDLVAGLARLGTSVNPLILQSNGGMAPVMEAAARPAAVLESGPAAGVVAAAEIARSLGEPRVLGFDMGGTTAKASLIEDGLPLLASSFAVGSDVSAMGRLTRSGGYPVQLPTIDLAEVGAGGSSLVRIDAAGGIQVGPDSAGALPGPACYGRGGAQVTVTDANLMLGLVSVEGLARNGIIADPEAARRAVREQVARPLGLDIRAAAYAVHETANLQMARALRAVTTERGRDLREYTLIAFGGSGPVHAATLAELVGMTRVLIPTNAGVLSAKGLVHSPVEISASETVLKALAEVTAESLAERFGRLHQGLAGRLGPGWDTNEIRASAAVDVRYQGQSSELRVELDGGAPAGWTRGKLHNRRVLGAEALDPSWIESRFTELHKSTYGYTSPSPVALVRLHATATARERSSIMMRPLETPGTASTGTRDVYLGGNLVRAAVLRRNDLAGPVPGPCVIDETDTSVIVPGGWTVVRDSAGNLILEWRR